MQLFQIRLFFLRRRIVWFPIRLGWLDALSLLDARQGGIETRSALFRQQVFNTELIDLSRSADDFYAGFDKDTLYDIRRAVRDGVEFMYQHDPLQFVALYERFSESKAGRGGLSLQDLQLFKDCLTFTYARFAGEVLVGHCYFLDAKSQIVRLLHSASDYRSLEDSKRRALIGRANRFLHARDMEYFTNEGSW